MKKNRDYSRLGVQLFYTPVRETTSPYPWPITPVPLLPDLKEILVIRRQNVCVWIVYNVRGILTRSAHQLIRANSALSAISIKMSPDHNSWSIRRTRRFAYKQTRDTLRYFMGLMDVMFVMWYFLYGLSGPGVAESEVYYCDLKPNELKQPTDSDSDLELQAECGGFTCKSLDNKWSVETWQFGYWYLTVMTFHPLSGAHGSAGYRSREAAGGPVFDPTITVRNVYCLEWSLIRYEVRYSFS